ncbi:MAG: glycosyltransferase [Candidatus Thorarchaeota archaeon]
MRVFFGKDTVSGILWDYKLSLKKVGIEADVILYDKHRFNYNYDYVLNPKGGKIRREIIAFLNISRLIRKYDIFNFFYGNSLLHFNLDVPLIRRSGKKIVMFFIGSDIRCNHLVLNKKMDKKECDFCGYPCRYEEKIRLVKYWERNADIIFSGVDNAQILEHYSMQYYPITLPIDTEQWKPSEEKNQPKNDIPLIVHAPSSHHMKGTEIILDTIEKLQDNYDFTFRLITNMSNLEAKEWLNKSDIVIDRARGRGWYGKLAVESMALSNTVVGYIDDDLRNRVKYGQEVPILNINEDNLYNILAYQIEDMEETWKIAQKSRKFVEKYHDNSVVGQEILDIYKKELGITDFNQ